MNLLCGVKQKIRPKPDFLFFQTQDQTQKRGICTAIHLRTLMQKPLLSGDGGIRTHDLYTARNTTGILGSFRQCYLLLLYIIEYSKLLIFVIIAHNMSAGCRKPKTCRQDVGNLQCHFYSHISPSAILLSPCPIFNRKERQRAYRGL